MHAKKDCILNTEGATVIQKSAKLRLRNSAWLFNWRGLDFYTVTTIKATASGIAAGYFISKLFPV